MTLSPVARCAIAAWLLLLSSCVDGAAPSHTPAAAPVHPLPVPARPLTGDRAAEATALDKIADAFRRFHTDTGEWPRARSEWHWRTDPQVDGMSFLDFDTALFTRPDNLPACTLSATPPCWRGPYLQGTSLADPAWQDHWGHSRFVQLVRPTDGRGGGANGAPDGLVVVWSAGPDGRDGYACSDGSCARNWSHMVNAQPSRPDADDVVVVAGTAR